MEYILTTNSTKCFYERILKTDIFYDKDLWKLTRCTTYTCPLTTYKVHDLRLSTDNGEVVKVVVEVDSIVSFIDDRPNSYKNTLTNYTTLNVSTFNNSIAEAVFKRKNHIYLSCMVISIIEEGPYNQIIYQVVLFGFAEFQEMSTKDTSYFWHWTVS